MDQSQRDGAVRLGLQVLLLNLGLRDDRDLIGIRAAQFPGGLDPGHRPLHVRHAAIERRGALLGFQEPYQAVFHLGIGQQNLVLVRNDQFSEAGILVADVVADAPIVQDIPLKGRSHPAGESLLSEQTLELWRRVPEVSGNHEAGIQFCFRNADLLGLCGNQLFRPTNIRSPTQQIGRDADHQLRRGRRNLPWWKFLPKVSRRHSQQDAHPVVSLAQFGFQQRHSCFGLGQDAFHLIDMIAPRLLEAAFRTWIAEFVQLPQRLGDLALQGDVLLDEFQTGFQSADLDVGRGDIAQQGHQHLVVTGAGSFQGMFCRNDGSAIAAPEIELPRQIESVAPVGEEVVPAAQNHFRRPGQFGALDRDRAVRAPGSCPPLEATRGSLRLREQVALCNPKLCTCLQDSKARLAQRQVVDLRSGDQFVQQRILKHRPPLAEIRRLLNDPFVPRVDPLVRRGGFWRAVVRTNLEPIARVLPQTSTSALQ